MANNAVIEAAKIANQPQENGLLKGFIQGIGSLATGMLQRQDKAKKKAAVLDKAYTGKTDIKSVSDIVFKTKQKVKNKELTVEQGVQALQSFSYDVNKYLPEIDKLMKDFSASGFSNASDSKHALLQNYVTSYTLGELNQPIKVNGKVIDAFIQTDAVGNLTMMGANGEQVPFSEVAAELRGMVQKTDGDKGAGYMNNFLGSKFKYGTESKYEESKDLLLSNLDKSMRDENSKMSMLFDNKYFAKGVEHTFADHYMETAMSQAERDEINNEIKKIKDPRAKEKAKSMAVINIMKGDENTEEDIKSFFDNLIEMKRPVKNTSTPKIKEIKAQESDGYTYMKIDVSKYTKDEARQLDVAEVIINSAHSIKKSDVASEKALQKYNLENNTGLGIELALGDKEGESQKVYFIKAMQGGEGDEVRISNEFIYNDYNLIDKLILPDLFNNTKGAPKFKTNVYNDIFNSLPSLN
tara:strand:+ start:411 stop:1811 length:1401 start_codon:yes stop_codon:yes gene_type:complete